MRIRSVSVPALSSELTLASLATTVVVASGDSSSGTVNARPKTISRLLHLKDAFEHKFDAIVNKVEKSQVLSQVGDKTEEMMKKAANDMLRVRRKAAEPVVVEPVPPLGSSDEIKATLTQKAQDHPGGALFLAYPKYYKPVTTVRKVESDPKRPWLISPTEAHVTWEQVNLTPDTELCLVYFLFHAVDDNLNSVPGIPDSYRSVDESSLEEMTRNMYLVRSEKEFSEEYQEDPSLRAVVAETHPPVVTNPPVVVNLDDSPRRRRRRKRGRGRGRTINVDDLPSPPQRIEHEAPKPTTPILTDHPIVPEDSGTTCGGAPIPTEPTLVSSSDGPATQVSEPAWLTEYCTLRAPSDPSPKELADLWRDPTSPTPSDDVSSLALTHETKTIRPARAAESACVTRLRDALHEIVEGRKPVVSQLSDASTPSPEIARLSSASEVDFYSKYIDYADQSKDFDSLKTPSPEKPSPKKQSPTSPLASVTFRWPTADPSRYSVPAVFYQPISTTDRPISLRHKVRPMDAPSMSLTSATWVHNAAHKRFGPQPVLSLWQRASRMAKKAWTSVKNFLLCRQGVYDEDEVSSCPQFL